MIRTVTLPLTILFKKIKEYTINVFLSSHKLKHKPNPLITTDILKLIKATNKVFIKLKTNPALRQEYNQYRNKLTMVIRNAKLN